jgi:hypothetical protein
MSSMTEPGWACRYTGLQSIWALRTKLCRFVRLRHFKDAVRNEREVNAMKIKYPASGVEKSCTTVAQWHNIGPFGRTEQEGVRKSPIKFASHTFPPVALFCSLDQSAHDHGTVWSLNTFKPYKDHSKSSKADSDHVGWASSNIP